MQDEWEVSCKQPCYSTKSINTEPADSIVVSGHDPTCPVQQHSLTLDLLENWIQPLRSEDSTLASSWLAGFMLAHVYPVGVSYSLFS